MLSSLIWVVHPASRSLLRTFGILLILVITTVTAAVAGDSAFLGVSSAVLLVFSLRHFFFPTHYTVDEYGVSIRCLGFETRRPWTRLRRFRYDGSGAFLSMRSRSSLLDSFTGLHMTWAGNKDEVVPLIERYMAVSGHRD